MRLGDGEDARHAHRRGSCGRRPAGAFSRRIGAVALWLALILAPLAAVAQSYSFSTVRVEGNQQVDAATVAGFARIPRGQTLTVSELNAAYQRVVNSGLFEEVTFEPRGTTLVITVAEFPTINVIAFEGNRRIDDDVLAGVIASQARRVFSPAQAERDAQAIADLYRTRGRFAAEVTPRIIQRGPSRVDLVFEVREGSVVEVERLSFVGNRAFSDSRLRRVLDTKQAGLLRTFVQRDVFVEERIQLDRALLRDFYLARGFIDFQVLSVTSEISREGDAFFVTFTIREGQQYRVGNVAVSSEIAGLDPEPFRREVRLRRGVIFSPTVIDANIARLETLAIQQGQRFVRVDPRITRNDRDGTVDVDFVLVSGERIFVERIDIQGNATTLDRVVRRQFRISEGDPLNPREIREAAERIRALGYFSDVQVEGRPGSTDDQVVVDVNVEETTTGSLGFGVSFARADGFGAAITFSERNFLGRGQQVEFVLSTTRGTRELTFDFTEPAVRDRNLSFGLRLSYRERELLDWTSFSSREFVLSPSIGFPVSPMGRMTLRYALQAEDVRDVIPGASAVIKADEGREITSLIGIGYTFDSRRSDLTPGFGMLLRFEQEIAGLGGDRRFLRSTGLAVVERRVLSEEVTLRAELEGGALNMISGDSRYLERFDLSQKMRGFRAGGIGPRDLNSDRREALGGNYFMVARFEADFPLGLPEEYGLAGGVFMDVGSAWGLDNRAGGPQGGPVSEVDDARRWRAAAGVSLFWDTPIGPLRFNFSRPLRKLDYDRSQAFDISISSRF